MNIRRTSATAVFAIMLVLFFCMSASVAFASLEDTWTASSSTNPGDRTSHDAFWRFQWGNSLTPEVTVNDPIPSDPDLFTTGMFYAFDMVPTTIPNPTFDPQFDFSSEPSGTLISHRFNIPALMATRSVWAPQPGTHLPGEGLWFLHVRFVNTNRVEDASGTEHVMLGVDQTAPAPVQSLRTTVDGTTTVSTWLPYTRRIIRWDDLKYDDLSGVGLYEIRVNGELRTKVYNTDPDPAFDWWQPYTGLPAPSAPRPTGLTFEQLPVGAARIDVVAVDRATNRSATRTTWAYSDADTPTASITYPTSVGQTLGIAPTFKASAHDDAGDPTVRFYVDGVLKATVSSAPYEYKANLSAYAQGSTHTLKVVATDHMDREAVATRTFKVDKVAPTIGSLSAGPTPFYPRKRDGYKDNLVIDYRVSERSNVDILVYTSSGKLWRTIAAGTKTGSASTSWDGKSSAGKVASGTFKLKVRATDSVGNTTSSGWKYAEIRFYQVVRVSGSAVRLIER